MKCPRIDFINLIKKSCKITFKFPPEQKKPPVDKECSPAILASWMIPGAAPARRTTKSKDGWSIDGPTSEEDPTWGPAHKNPADYDENGKKGSKINPKPKGNEAEGFMKEDIPGIKDPCEVVKEAAGLSEKEFEDLKEMLKKGGKTDDEIKEATKDLKRESDDIKGWSEATLVFVQEFQAWVICVWAEGNITILGFYTYQQTMTVDCLPSGKPKDKPKVEQDKGADFKEPDKTPKEDKDRLKELLEKDGYKNWVPK